MEAATQGPAPPDWQRRLLTILFADVVGYSRMMGVAEEETHARMRALLVDVISPCVVGHRGEIIKGTGDGFVSCFDSARDAVQAAVALQTAVQEREAHRPPDRRIVFRIGVNVQDVIVEGQVDVPYDVFGDGVNIAARLEQCAPPGGVVISAAVKERLGSDQRPAEDLGELRLKNIAKPVRAFSLALPGALRSAAHGISVCAEGRARPPGLAIMPLRNLSPHPEDDYFGSGVIDDLIVSLSGLNDVFVISRGSTASLPSTTTADVASQRLGVRYVLGGSVRRTGQHLSFTFALTDTGADAIMWAERFDCGLDEVFELQDHVVEKTVSTIAAQVRQAEIRRALRKRPEALDAYDYLLRGLNLLHTLDFQNFSRARQLLEHAIELDDDYAAAYTYAAQWHIFNIGQGWSSDTRADANEALRLATLALERDPLYAQALAVHGHAKGMCFRDYDAALDCFDRALSLSPSNAWASMLSSGTLAYVGDAPQSIERARRALRLSPIDQYGFYHASFMGLAFYCGDAFEEALAWCRKSYALNTKFCSNLRYMAASLVAMGALAEAREVAKRHQELQPRFGLVDYAPRCPFSDDGVNALWLGRLRAAGFPD